MSESILIQQQREMLIVFRKGTVQRIQTEPAIAAQRQSAVDAAQKTLGQALESARERLDPIQAAQIRAPEALAAAGLGEIWSRIEPVASRKASGGNALAQLSAVSTAGDHSFLALQTRADMLLQSRQAQRGRRNAMVALALGALLIAVVAGVIAVQARQTEQKYQSAKLAFEAGQWDSALSALQELQSSKPNYRDSQDMINESYYQNALILLANKAWVQTRSTLSELAKLTSNYKDSGVLLRESYYLAAKDAIGLEEWAVAAAELTELVTVDPDYRDAMELLRGVQQVQAAAHAARWVEGRAALSKSITGIRNDIESVAWSTDGQLLAVANQTVGGEDGLRLWNVANGQAVMTLESDMNVEDIAISSDGKTLVVVGSYSVQFWDLPTAQLQRTLSHPTGSFYQQYQGLALSPDGRSFALVLWDGRVELHQIAAQLTASRTGDLGDEVPLSVAFSPDGKTLVVGGGYGTVRSWQLASGSSRSWEVGDFVPSLSYYPTGQYLAMVADGMVKLWSTSGWQEVRSFTEIGSVVTAVAFSPNGEYMAIGGAEGDLEIWVAE